MRTSNNALFDPWAETLAWQQTWLADLDPNAWGPRLQAQRADRLLDWTIRHSPLYAKRARHARRLEDLPPIGKAELMGHFDEWATDRRITLAGAEAFLARAQSFADPWLGAYQVWTSSGTTGKPGIFIQDRASLAAYDALEALRLQGLQTGLRTGLQTGLPPMAPWLPKRRLAYVAAIGGPYAGHVSIERLAALVPPPWAPDITKISVLLPLGDIARQLDALQPDVLITYPSCAMALAERQACGDLRLRLEELWLGGEHIGPVPLGRLRAVFACPVHSSYGASEAYSIACSCPLGHLHLNADWVILEPVDAQHRPVAAGVLSDMALLTNLANFVQPLLRYELTDRVRMLPQPCACGNAWPVIEVHGRSDEVLVVPARGGGTVTLLPLALETMLEEQAGIIDFQLIARRDGGLELRLPQARGAAALARRGRDAVQDFLQRHGAEPMRVIPVCGAPLRQAGSGKLRRVLAMD